MKEAVKLLNAQQEAVAKGSDYEDVLNHIKRNALKKPHFRSCNIAPNVSKAAIKKLKDEGFRVHEMHEEDDVVIGYYVSW